MTKKTAPVEWELVDEAFILDCLSKMHGQPVIVDTETDGLLVKDGQHTAKYLGLVFAADPELCFILKAPFSKELREALCSTLLVGHNIRFDAHALGLNLTGAAPWDTMLRIYGHSTTTLKSLDDVAPRLGYSKIPTPPLILEGRINELSTEEVAPYLADDCAVTAHLFRQQVRSQGAASDLNILDFDTERAVLNMERRGVRLIESALDGLRPRVDQFIEVTAADLERLGWPRSVNLNSPQQVMAEFKRHGVKLPKLPIKNSKTGVREVKETTRKQALEILDRQGQPHAIGVLMARKALKMRSGFLVPLPTFISPRTGLIHAGVNTCNTKTSRFSYEDPNLQQVPKQGSPCADECGSCVFCVQTALALAFRHCFTSRSGRVAGADFGQVEMRVAAAKSGDPGLLEIFSNREDLHRGVAARIFGVPLDKVQKHQRFKAKAVNFGILNGMGAGRLAHEMRVDKWEAQRFLDDYLKTFSGLHEWMQATWRECEEYQLARTLLGHQRVFGADEDTRPGISVVVQGSAADLMRAALVSLDRAGLQPILAVHDEILVDATRPSGDLTSGEEVATVMSEAANALWRKVTGSLPVEFTAAPGEGRTWGEC